MLDGIKNYTIEEITSFTIFMEKNQIFTTAIGIVIASFLSNIFKKFADEIIIPLAGGKIDKLKQKKTYKEYLFLIFHFILITFIFYKILSLIT